MIKRTTFFSLILAAIVGIGLFVVKDQVQDLENELRDINREIADERVKRHVLRAEWSHLNEPDRLRQKTVRHLNLIPLAPEQFISEDQLSDVIENNLELEMLPNSSADLIDFNYRMEKALNGGKSE